jgi:hypothetical protein
LILCKRLISDDRQLPSSGKARPNDFGIGHWAIKEKALGSRIALPVLAHPVVIGVVNRLNLSDVPGQVIKVVGIRAGVVAFTNQDHVSVLHRNRYVEVGIPRVNALNGKTVFGQETIIIGLLVEGGIISRVVAMGWETSRNSGPIALGAPRPINLSVTARSHLALLPPNSRTFQTAPDPLAVAHG